MAETAKEKAAATAAAAEPMKSAADRASTSGDGSGPRDYEAILEDRFEGLNLHGEEEEELDLSCEIEGLIAETRWIAIFRVHTQKPFSHVSLFKSVKRMGGGAGGNLQTEG